MTENQPRPGDPAPADPENIINREEREAFDLYDQATQRQSAAAGRETVNFGRQMLQLVLIPALIVGGILAVWMLVVSLGGQAQSLNSVLEKLSTTGGAAPASQERARTALSLLSIIETAANPTAEPLTPEEHDRLVTQLPGIIRLQRQGNPELCQALLGALGLLGDASTIKVFQDFLASPDPQDWFAAVSGLRNWRGDMADLRPLTPDLLKVLRNAPRPTENPRDDRPVESLAALTASVLAVVAQPSDEDVIDALAKVLDNAAPATREISWNAGCALAVLGDERGVPVVVSLLDRGWLERQPFDPRNALAGTMDAGSVRKVLTSTINVVVGFDPRLRGFAVRVSAPSVWSMIERLAESDPDLAVREAASAALQAREPRQNAGGGSGGG